jgi:hypothetical protein
MSTINQETLDVLNTAMAATDTNISDFEPEELMALCIQLNDDLEGSELDICLDLPAGEVRIISDDHIDELWTESLIEQIKECYELDEVPSFVAIDWEQTAENCKVDGKGHHFSSYDGNEYATANFNIFRTN